MWTASWITNGRSGLVLIALLQALVWILQPLKATAFVLSQPRTWRHQGNPQEPHTTTAEHSHAVPNSSLHRLPMQRTACNTASQRSSMALFAGRDRTNRYRANKPKNRPMTGYEKRAAGIKVKRGPKPPKWEKEGDLLYKQVEVGASSSSSTSSSGNDEDDASFTIPETIRQGEIMLNELAATLAPTQPQMGDADKQEGQEVQEVQEEEPTSPSPPKPTPKPTPKNNPFLWGSLSVGPVLKKQLVDAGMEQPTAVQTAAFTALTNRTAITSINRNAIIASPTGSGKSLAYLLPLLANSKSGKRLPAMIMVVTPTLTLSYQLQREVNRLWPPQDQEDGRSLLYVADLEEADADAIDSLDSSCIVAGTPRGLRAFWNEVEAAASAKPKPRKTSEDSFQDLLSEMGAIMDIPDLEPTTPSKAVMMKDRNIRAKQILSNLQTVVLDEADRLLRTQSFSQAPPAKGAPKRAGKKPATAVGTGQTQTEKLLGALPTDRLQIICASATVGRTLRRQIMDIVDASSMDRAAHLITAVGDRRTGKDAAGRSSALLSDTLKHNYMLTDGKTDGGIDVMDVICCLSGLLDTLPPAPVLIFTGKYDIKLTQQALKTRTYERVSVITASNPPAESVTGSEWRDTTIHVATRNLGRGLDIQGVRYVVMLSPPTSPSEYIHLSGRTGRNGLPGDSIVLGDLKDVPKIMYISKTLGIPMRSAHALDGAAEVNDVNVERANEGDDGGNEGSDEEDSDRGDEEHGPPVAMEWATISKSQLQRKTKQEMIEYLESHDVSPELEKNPKKADLMIKIDYLHKVSA